MEALLSLLDTPEPPHLTMKARAGTKSLAELDAQLKPILAEGNMDARFRELARAAVYLWHDHFDAAHSLAQDVEDADGSLLHGILHRREPDYSNARYWFRRVGATHRSFECVAKRTKELLKNDNFGPTAREVIPNDRWHPLAFVDVVENAARRNDPEIEKLLRQIQAAEIRCYLDTLPSRVA